MARLVINNVSSSDTVVFDKTGETTRKIEVAAGATVTTDGLTVDEIENLKTPLLELETAGTITFFMSEEPSGDARFESLSAPGMVMRELTQTVDADDLTAAAAEQSIAITGFPANSFPMAAAIELDLGFDGGALSALVASIGDAAALGELCTSQNVFSGQTAGMKSTAGDNAGEFVFETAYSPVVYVSGTGANVNAAVNGSMIAHVWYMTPTLAS